MDIPFTLKLKKALVKLASRVKIAKTRVRTGIFPRKFLHWASETSFTQNRKECAFDQQALQQDKQLLKYLQQKKIIIHWGNELWAIPGVNREAVCNNLWKTSSAIKQLVREKTITEWKKIYTTRELKWTVDDDNIEKDCINYKKPQLFSLPVSNLINRCSHLQFVL